jgi:hypothetical protein
MFLFQKIKHYNLFYISFHSQSTIILLHCNVAHSKSQPQSWCKNCTNLHATLYVSTSIWVVQFLHQLLGLYLCSIVYTCHWLIYLFVLYLIAEEVKTIEWQKIIIKFMPKSVPKFRPWQILLRRSIVHALSRVYCKYTTSHVCLWIFIYIGIV